MQSNNDKAKTTQQQLEENLRNFQPQKSEAAEKAKRILFGRTDIGDEKNPFDKISDPINWQNWETHRAKVNYFNNLDASAWIDPEMTGPIGSELKHPLSEETKQMISNIEFVNPLYLPSDEEIINIKLNQKSLTMILDYCNEIGVSPEQLIEDHKKFVSYWGGIDDVPR